MVDNFFVFEDEIIEYMKPNDTDYKKRIKEYKKEAEKDSGRYVYEHHEKIGEFCDYEFYYFHSGFVCFECTKHIAMIDHNKHTIAFLDTLLLPQTLDSITNVLKNCEQVTTPKQLSDFFENIRAVYHHNEINSIQLRGTYSSPSQDVIYLLSAENALDFEKAKRYIDFERIYKSQEEWEQKVKANPPRLDFHNYWFEVEENGRNAIIKTRYEGRWTTYYVRQDKFLKRWKVIRIESN